MLIELSPLDITDSHILCLNVETGLEIDEYLKTGNTDEPC